MKRFESLRTWLVIVGLLLFSGVASLAWIALSGQGGIRAPSLGLDLALEPIEPITIELEDYLLGEALVEAPVISQLNGQEVPYLLVVAIIVAVTVGGLLAMGVPLAFIYVLLDRQAGQVKEDSEFQEQQAALQKKETERLRALNEEHPPTEMPSHEMPRWAVTSTALIVLFFAVLIGYALSDTFFPEGEVQLTSSIFVNPALIISSVLGIISLIALAAALGRRTYGGEDEEVSRIPWGAIWVAITGFIFLGIGMGLMFAIRSAGG